MARRRPTHPQFAFWDGNPNAYAPLATTGPAAIAAALRSSLDEQHQSRAPNTHQDMEPGTIFYLPPAAMVSSATGLADGAFNHPVVFLSGDTEDEKMCLVAVITSFNNRALASVAHTPETRHSFLELESVFSDTDADAGVDTDADGDGDGDGTRSALLLRFCGRKRLDRFAYVHIKSYAVPRAALRPWLWERNGEGGELKVAEDSLMVLFTSIEDAGAVDEGWGEEWGWDWEGVAEGGEVGHGEGGAVGGRVEDGGGGDSGGDGDAGYEDVYTDDDDKSDSGGYVEDDDEYGAGSRAGLYY